MLVSVCHCISLTIAIYVKKLTFTHIDCSYNVIYLNHLITLVFWIMTYYYPPKSILSYELVPPYHICIFVS